MTKYKEWLATLDVGAEWTAVYFQRWGHDEIVKVKIIGETPTRWRVMFKYRNSMARDAMYKKANGILFGHGSHATLPMPATEQEVDKVKRSIEIATMAKKINKINWIDQNESVIRRVFNIIAEGDGA